MQASVHQHRCHQHKANHRQLSQHYWMCQLLPTAKIIVFRQVANIFGWAFMVGFTAKKDFQKMNTWTKKTHHMFFLQSFVGVFPQKKKSNFWISVTSSVPVRLCGHCLPPDIFALGKNSGLKTGRKLWRRGGFHGWIVDLLWVLHGLCGTGMASLGERGWGGGVFRTGGGLAEVAPNTFGGVPFTLPKTNVAPKNGGFQ